MPNTKYKSDGEFKDSKEDMFEKLENDETVDSAVSIIAKRIADAEAEFIKRNAEDKAKIEKIADKIDERIQAVNQSDKPEEVKDQEKDEDDSHSGTINVYEDDIISYRYNKKDCCQGMTAVFFMMSLGMLVSEQRDVLDVLDVGL